MKVEFTSYGVLTITPENHTENYALSKWEEKRKEEEPKMPETNDLVINLYVRDCSKSQASKPKASIPVCEKCLSSNINLKAKDRDFVNAMKYKCNLCGEEGYLFE